MKIREEVRRMKGVAPRIAASREEQRNRILERVAASLEEHAEEIFTENRKDLAPSNRTAIYYPKDSDSKNWKTTKIL